jgi:catechol-2,3-dioxygenase
MRTLITLSLLTVATLAAGDAPKRPKILGVAHIALSAHDIGQSQAFYKDFLGYQEPFIA